MTLQSSHPTVFRQILSKLELSSDEFEDAVAVSAVDLENNALGDDQSQSTVYTNPNALEDADAGNYLNRNQGRDTFLKARIGEGIDDQLATMKKDAVCDCKTVVSAAKEANTMTAYINNLLNYPDEIGVLWRTVRILKDKTLNSNELATSNKEEIATLNGIELITSSMSSFPNHEGLNMLGIKTLGNLAFNNNDNRARIGQKNGVDVVLDAMSVFIKKVDLCGCGCVTLTNIAHTDDNNKRIIVNRGGLEKILDAMQEFVDDFDLQKKAVWSILTISAEPSCARRCASSGCVGAILAAMLNFSSDASICYFSIWALCNICAGGGEVCVFM
ncbi:hypothetical protein ScalyP_jg10267 [Parmales sp. scaly parma]|nr:hypothetical protein ScalyP_jg10267 [Parmales sp. scaly parma]